MSLLQSRQPTYGQRIHVSYLRYGVILKVNPLGDRTGVPQHAQLNYTDPTTPVALYLCLSEIYLQAG